MKKIILTLLIILLGLFAVYFIYNQFDGPPAKFNVGENLDISSPQAFIDSYYPEISLDYNNGYYRMWSLVEPEGTDIESEETNVQYRRLHDPKYDVKKFTKEADPMRNRELFKDQVADRKRIIGDNCPWFDAPGHTDKDWARLALEGKDKIHQLSDAWKVVMSRYDKLIQSEFYQDFTLPVLDGQPNYAAPIPNLLAWLQAAKLYISLQLIDGMEGNWQQAATNLLNHLEFHAKTMKGGGTLIHNLVGKAIFRFTLQGLANLMNQKDCPIDVFQMVKDRLHPIGYADYGSKEPLLFELYMTGMVDGGFLLQENRTRQYLCDLTATIYLKEKTPPYLWESKVPKVDSFKKGAFWWLQNPGGKIKAEMVRKDLNAGLTTAVIKSHYTKILYDLTRISAELHLEYSADKPVEEILAGLKSYRELLDPCSGKPYKWNGEKQILYSLGVDLKDDGGKDQLPDNYNEGDYALPVILFLK